MSQNGLPSRADQNSEPRVREKIFVGIPSRDPIELSICGGLVKTLNEMKLNRNYEVRILQLGGYPVDRMRNLLVQEFMESDFSYLLMIDDDILPPEDVLDMARHGKDIVGAVCYAWNQRVGIFSVIYNSDPDNPGGYKRMGIGREVENKGLLETELIGSGCFMIHRRVFETLGQPYFRTLLNKNRLDLVDSEDFDFCRRAKKAGFRVYIDTDRVCGHIKSLDLRKIVSWVERYRSADFLQQLIGQF